MATELRPHRNTRPERLLRLINTVYPGVRKTPGKAERAIAAIRTLGVDWEGERERIAKAHGWAFKQRHQYGYGWKAALIKQREEAADEVAKRPRPDGQAYMGAAEVAEYRNVSKQVVYNWRKRGKLPESVVVLAMGPIWATETIVKHFEKVDSDAAENS